MLVLSFALIVTLLLIVTGGLLWTVVEGLFGRGSDITSGYFGVSDWNGSFDPPANMILVDTAKNQAVANAAMGAVILLLLILPLFLFAYQIFRFLLEDWQE